MSASPVSRLPMIRPSGPEPWHTHAVPSTSPASPVSPHVSGGGGGGFPPKGPLGSCAPLNSSDQYTSVPVSPEATSSIHSDQSPSALWPLNAARLGKKFVGSAIVASDTGVSIPPSGRKSPLKGEKPSKM